MSQQCIDPIVGKILAGWRYDISGLAPEMRGDYESHFAGCERCRSRQRMHRMIDVGLIALASVSGGVFLLAFGVIRHFGPRHAFWLEIAALAGFALSALIWLVVAVATPAPVTVLDAARQGARRVHDRLPPEIRERLPEELAGEDYRDIDMIRSLPRISALRIITVALLGAVLSASAGATCLFSAPVHSSSAGSPHTGCHPHPALTKIALARHAVLHEVSGACAAN